MYAYAGNNPVMNIDPDGDSFIGIITLLVLVADATLTALMLVSVAPAENHSEDNISVSGGTTPYPSIYGFDVMGVGISGTYGHFGTTCNVIGKCQDTIQFGANAGLYGVDFTQFSDNDNSLTLSYGPFFLSLDNGKYLDIYSYGAGISFGFSGGYDTGSASGSIDVDIFGLLIDLVKKGEN